MGLSVLFATLALSACIRAGGDSGPYDGSWWSSVGKEERTGFLAGYIDCDSDSMGRSRVADVRWNRAEAAISEYYATHVSERNMRVALVLVRIAPQVKRRTTGRGEIHGEKHGIFDGEYWRVSSPAHRHGFIQGYLQCLQEGGRGSGYPHRVEWYVSRISQWYGLTSDDPSEANAQRADRKIADVLELVKD